MDSITTPIWENVVTAASSANALETEVYLSYSLIDMQRIYMSISIFPFPNSNVVYIYLLKCVELLVALVRVDGEEVLVTSVKLPPKEKPEFACQLLILLPPAAPIPQSPFVIANWQLFSSPIPSRTNILLMSAKRHGRPTTILFPGPLSLIAVVLRLEK